MKLFWDFVDGLDDIDNPTKVKSEVLLLSIFAGDVAICYAFDDAGDESTFAVLNEYYDIIDESFEVEEMLDVTHDRRNFYGEAVQNPHPEFGIAFAVGEKFCDLCDDQRIDLRTYAASHYNLFVTNSAKFLNEVRKENQILLPTGELV